MYQVKKRDGKVINFEIQKISTAITMAFEACERNFNENIIDFLALLLVALFQLKFFVKGFLCSVNITRKIEHLFCVIFSVQIRLGVYISTVSS